MVRPLDKLLNKPVIVYTSRSSYRGLLKEVREDGISLRGGTAWQDIPMDQIQDIQPVADT